MDIQDLLRELHQKNDSKIVLIVADGLGGLPVEFNGPTELELARTPNLDELARGGVCGLLTPILPGITAGSGPGHLALFGYDPLRYTVGRGVLSALGIEFDLQPHDVAARGNFCTVDDDLVVKDRRAGRPSDQDAMQLVKKLGRLNFPASSFSLNPSKNIGFALCSGGTAWAPMSAIPTRTPPAFSLISRRPRIRTPGGPPNWCSSLSIGPTRA